MAISEAKLSKSVFVPQLFQKYQMMPDSPRHGGMLPVRNSKLLGGLFHNPGERSVVSVANKRAQMMGNVVVEPAGEPAHEWVFSGVIGRGGKNMVNAVFKFAAVRG